MSRVIRWLIRLVSLAILAVVFSLLPVLMPGPSRLLSLLHMLGLVVAVDFSFLLLLASLAPSPPKKLERQPPHLRTPDAEALRRAAVRLDQRGGAPGDL